MYNLIKNYDPPVWFVVNYDEQLHNLNTITFKGQLSKQLFFSFHLQPAVDDDGPPAKKSKTEDDLMPEHEFLKTHMVGWAKIFLQNSYKTWCYTVIIIVTPLQFGIVKYAAT